MIISSQIKLNEKRCLIVAPNSTQVVREQYGGLLQGLRSSFDQRSRGVEECFVLSTEVAIGTSHNEPFYERIKKKIISKDFDLIFTIGRNCSMMLQEITMKQRIFTPIVFSAVLNPHDIGLATYEYRPYHHITGVSAKARDYNDQISTLCDIVKGVVKTVALLKGYLGVQRNEEELIAAHLLLESKGFYVREVIIDDTKRSVQSLAEVLPYVDFVFMPRDTELIKHIADIVSICNDKQTPIYASDKESVNLGAVLGCGTEEHIIGVETAEKAIPILFDSKLPSAIPVTPLQNDKLRIVLNIAAVRTQAGIFKEPLKRLFDHKNVETIHP